VAEETFADRLRALREARGLSQYELAKRSGLSKQTLSRLEMDTVPSWPTVQALARALGVSVAAFEPGETSPPKRRGNK
jgi:transcriptional regulator with XRE-family HTH domain